MRGGGKAGWSGARERAARKGSAGKGERRGAGGAGGASAHELAAVPAPDEQAGSRPVSEKYTVCVVPAVVTGPTVPPTDSAPEYV